MFLLDEATSNLDSENEQRIQRAIDALHSGVTIVIITHRLSAIRNADLIHCLRTITSSNPAIGLRLLKKATGFSSFVRCRVSHSPVGATFTSNLKSSARLPNTHHVAAVALVYLLQRGPKISLV